MLAATITRREPKTAGVLLWWSWVFISLFFFLVGSDMGFALYRRFFVPADGSPVSFIYYFLIRTCSAIISVAKKGHQIGVTILWFRAATLFSGRWTDSWRNQIFGLSFSLNSLRALTLLLCTWKTAMKIWSRWFCKIKNKTKNKMTEISSFLISLWIG